MKKGLLFSLFLTFIFVFSFLTKVIAETDSLENISTQIEKTQDSVSKLSDSESRNDFLKQQWIELIKKSQLGKFMESTIQTIKPINPLIEFLIGVEFSWSLLFLVTFVIWISIGIYTKRALTFFDIFSKYFRYVISIVTAIVFAIIGITKVISYFIVNRINSLPSLWLKLIVGVIIIIIILYLSIFSKILEKIFKNIQRKREQSKLKRDVKSLKKQIKEPKEDDRYQEIGKDVLEEVGRQAEEDYK